MDGAGRLARSNRPTRPQIDLKAAALGAAVLLREWLGSKRSSVQSRRPQRLEHPPRLIAFLERNVPRRAGLVATLLLLLASAGLGIIKGGHAEQFTANLSDARNSLANTAGFRITTVAINGRRQLSQDEVLTIGGVSGRSSLLFLDAGALREKLKANPWISEATVLKLYPGQLQIDIGHVAVFRTLVRKSGVDAESEAELFRAVQAKDVPSLRSLVRKLDRKSRDALQPFTIQVERDVAVQPVVVQGEAVAERREEREHHVAPLPYLKATVREVFEEINRRRPTTYTTVLKFMQIMQEKGLLKRDDTNMKHIYSPAEPEQKTKNALLDKFVDNMYNGSVSSLVMQLLGNKKTSKKELQAIKELLNKMESGK